MMQWVFRMLTVRAFGGDRQGKGQEAQIRASKTTEWFAQHALGLRRAASLEGQQSDGERHAGGKRQHSNRSHLLKACHPQRIRRKNGGQFRQQ